MMSQHGVTEINKWSQCLECANDPIALVMRVIFGAYQRPGVDVCVCERESVPALTDPWLTLSSFTPRSSSRVTSQSERGNVLMARVCGASFRVCRLCAGRFITE